MDINLWNKYGLDTMPESMQIKYWQGIDSEKKYQECINKKIVPPYSRSDILYQYDVHGFRYGDTGSSSPHLLTKPLVLVSGCSFTEGIGLPENHIWHSFLLDKINKPTSKLNLGKGGRSIAAIVRHIYVSIDTYSIRPDFVYLLLPPVYRMELILKDNDNISICNFMAHMASTWEKKERYEEVNPEFKQIITHGTNQNWYHQAFLQLLFLQMFLELKNIPWYFSFWNNGFDKTQMTEMLGDDNSTIPESLTKHYIGGVINYEKEIPPNEQRYTQQTARDLVHPGPNYHYLLAEQLYARLLTKPDFRRFIL